MAGVNGRYLKFLQNIFKRNTNNNDHEALITAMGQALETVEEDTNLVVESISLATAEGEWLEEYGSIFGVSRTPNETDEHLRYRILTCMDDKISIPAIKRGIKKLLGDDTEITIFEPYTELRRFNVSTFSNDGRFPDSDYWRIGVVDIKINKPVTDEVIGYINQLIGVGIKAVIEQSE